MIKLIPDVKESWKFSSVRLGIIAAVVSQVWFQSPDLQALVPEGVAQYFTLGAILLALVARVTEVK